MLKCMYVEQIMEDCICLFHITFLQSINNKTPTSKVIGIYTTIFLRVQLFIFLITGSVLVTISIQTHTKLIWMFVV